jgi:hypothetical protein
MPLPQTRRGVLVKRRRPPALGAEAGKHRPGQPLHRDLSPEGPITSVQVPFSVGEFGDVNRPGACVGRGGHPARHRQQKP